MALDYIVRAFAYPVGSYYKFRYLPMFGLNPGLNQAQILGLVHGWAHGPIRGPIRGQNRGRLAWQSPSGVPVFSVSCNSGFFIYRQ